MVNHLSSTDFYPFGNPIQKVATTNPPRFALRPSQPSRLWPRVAKVCCGNLLDEPRQSIKEFDYEIQATFRQ